MKKRLLSLLTCLALCLTLLPTAALAASTAYPSFSTWKTKQTTPNQVEFEFTLFSTPKAGTTYKVYGEEERLSKVGTAALKENTDTTLVVTLDTAPTRDTRYFISATAPECDESIYSGEVIVDAYDYATSLGYSYGDYEDLTYSEFYQDELNYKVVLPTGTAQDAPISLNIETANGATVTYGGDTSLTNGSGVATATVTSADESLSRTYTVDFSTMSLQGEGTEESPYLISTADELLQLAICHNSGAAAPMDVDGCGYGNHCGYYFKQTKDINMKGIAWEPIGHSGSTYFAGNYDGNGCTISNLTSTGKTNKDSYDCTLFATSGLFGWVAFGKISNVTVRDAKLSATGFGEMAYVGGLMGVAFACTVESCSVYDSTITSYRTPNNSNFAGGLAGTVYVASFDKCSSVGNTIKHGSYGGGLIGSNDDDTTPFTNCMVADCTIIGYSQTAQIGTQSGAVMGASQGGTTDLTNCFAYNCKTITDESSLGDGTGGIFSGATWDVTDGDIVTSNTYYYDTNNMAVNDNTATAKTEEEFRDGTVLDWLGEAFIQGERYPIVKPLIPPHTHSCSYELSKTVTANDTIIQKCVNEDGKCAEPNTSVTIKAPESRTYTGGEISATVTDNSLGITAGNIKYQQATGVDSWEDIASAPINVGTYKASITLGEDDDAATASVIYTIAQAAGSSSNGGVSTTTTITKNEDGSVTTTVTNKITGTVTETTKNTDGSSTVVETKKDGTVTETNTTSDGVTGTVVTNKDGEVTEVSTKVPPSAVEEDKAVAIPVTVKPGTEINIDVPSGGTKVEIPVEEVTPGHVVVIVNKDGSETIVKTSVVTQNGVVLTLEADATVKIINGSKYFEDVHPVKHWATDAVDFVSARGMMNGTGSTTFSPDTPMTRGMLAVVLHNLEGNPDHAYEGSFEDVPADMWCADAIHWAAENGIVTGYGNGNFGPNDKITREQLAIMLWRYAGSPESSHSLDGFADADTVGDYAKQALAWANENGIVGGYDTGKLGPKDNATRAQVAAMLMRYISVDTKKD